MAGPEEGRFARAEGRMRHDSDDELGGLERREGLIDDIERNDKYLSLLQERLEVLYDRISPILTPERPTGDSESAKAVEADQRSDLRIQVRRQQRMIERMTSKILDYTERVEL